ncbi:hypothetical protein D3H65_21665 [Paraflavitalea soli]|uniref:Uncharacterized protein n=1 Tax=Paraflavitalea soli TaxID=2315862 RepID=A0A3B7MPK1_9BACT|nr:hypothetical protein [Paraflavitalea soli]AXY76444.1 hypothetical protein D3H65_21665 [Paraflavitalea soli]
MANKLKPDTAGSMVILPLVLVNAIIIKNSFIGNGRWLWLLMITVPLLLLVVLKKRKEYPRSEKRSPVLRRLRYSFESDRRERRVRRHEESQYIRYKVFSKGR